MALIALACLADLASVDAQGAETSRDRHEHRPAERERHTPRREVQARASRSAHPAHANAVHAPARPEASFARAHSAVSPQRAQLGRSMNERRLADGRIVRETQLAGGGRVREVSGGLAGSHVRVVRYGNAVSGTVERTIRPGLLSRTFVSGGHVLYTRVYQRHVWHQFGRAFAYETFVPAVRYPAVYYAWALAAWSRPLAYTWGWRVQPWYPTYGVLFTPYPVYTSPDLWMTDYIIAQSMQTAYQAQAAPPALLPPPLEAPGAPTPDSSIAVPAAEPNGAVPASPPSDAVQAVLAPQPSDAVPPAPQSGEAPSAPVALPPAVTPQIKAQLDAAIKVQLQDQQAATAMPATLTTPSTPPALRPNHVFFEVVQPLDVPAGADNRYCSLRPNDYIKRTGGMSDGDWTIPVVVELSGPSDCPEGLQTRIGLNDLNAMENEQEAQVMEALQEASKSMGPNGPPSGPGARPSLIADGSAAPDPMALDAIREAQ